MDGGKKVTFEEYMHRCSNRCMYIFIFRLTGNPLKINK